MKARKRERSAREVLAENVRSLREGLGLSQEALADAAGFHRTYVSQVERMKTNVSLDNIERLAVCLGVATHVVLVDGEHASLATTVRRPEGR